MTAQDNAVVFVQHVLEQICSNKEAVSIEVKTDDRGTVIFVTVAGEDMGKLIGKRGQNVSALRSLVRVIGARENERLSLKVVEKV